MLGFLRLVNMCFGLCIMGKKQDRHLFGLRLWLYVAYHECKPLNLAMTKKHTPIPHHAIKSHHKKPYRVHHVTMAGLSLLLILVSVVFIAIFYLAQPVAPPIQQDTSSRQARVDESSYLRSTAGHSLQPDTDLFRLSARDALDAELEPIELPRHPSPLQAVRLEPKPGASDPRYRSSSLTFTYGDTISGPDAEIIRKTLGSFDEDTYDFIDETTEAVAGQDFRKQTYRYESELTDIETELYRVIWIGAQDDITYVISLQGLIGSAEIPNIYAAALDSFTIGNSLGLQFFGELSDNWVARSPSTNQYLSDLVSPAVTKIYHVVCASISFEFAASTDQQCRAVTGSGFLISNDGYIATNGHVVVYEPEDVLVDTLLSNPLELSSFLTNVVGLDETQISRLQTQPEELAAIVAKIYELPDDTITFRDKREAILVSLGQTPLQPETEEDVAGLFNFRNTQDIKKASLVDFSYSGKDQLNLASGSAEGFTQSDVALLKVPLDNAPLIQLAAPADVSPGQEVALLGFPNDAENQLVDTSELVVSITNGTISSVRTAAGGEGQLLQTDTDASQGNSGGPGVTADGKALGLLTYRFKDGTTQNAAKSYIRDIRDVRQLLRDQDITLDLNSRVQQAWNAGLEDYAQRRFRDARESFETVAELYPAHRLVASYIDASEQNIAQGLDRSGSPLAFISGLVVGVSMLGLSIELMRHHRKHHHAYNQLHDANTTQPSTQSDPL